MVIVFRGNRIQCLNADVGSLPTTGVSTNMICEVCDTNVWKYFNGSSWTNLGTNTIDPCGEIPGDVNGNFNVNGNANGRRTAPYQWGQGTWEMPFNAILSTQNLPPGNLAGAQILITDTSTTLHWHGTTLAPGQPSGSWQAS